MHDGTIKSLNLQRGFGFIARPNARDIFFHCSDLDGALIFDEQLIERRVRFDVVGTPKGDRAAKVLPAD